MNAESRACTIQRDHESGCTVAPCSGRAYVIANYEPRPVGELLLDICAVDYPKRERRFDVVYHFLSMYRNHRIRVKAAVREDEMVPSITEPFPAANWFEREAWDMFGIDFSGHPNLRRILLPPTWEGHALRKDHPARATEMEPFSLDQDRQDA